MRCDWKLVVARTPTGAVRHVNQCCVCKRIKFRHYGAVRFVWPDGRVHESRTVDESDCGG